MEQEGDFRSECRDHMRVDGLGQAGSNVKGENWSCCLVAWGWMGVFLERRSSLATISPDCPACIAASLMKASPIGSTTLPRWTQQAGNCPQSSPLPLAGSQPWTDSTKPTRLPSLKNCISSRVTKV